MQVEVKVEGLDRIDRATQRVRDLVAKEITTALYLSAKKVEREAKESILAGNKTGRVYKRRTVTHRASAPGEAPASDTGRLVNSIHGELDTAKPGEAFVVAGRGAVKYAAMLEFGTVKIAPRPFLHPALEKSRRWIAERIQNAVVKAARAAGKGG